MIDPITGLGLVALMGALATIAGAAEDLESDVGSQSNPNSQVQLAAQMDFPHRIFNKAISGEPPAYGLWCATGATVASVLLAQNMSVIFAIAIGSLAGAILLGLFSVTAHMGRTASQKRFKQPVYMDMVIGHVPSIMAHGFIAVFCIVSFSYIMDHMLGHPFPLPLLAFLWGVTAGAIGSSTGDVHYGAEREFQNQPFGSGLNAAQSGNIVRKAESGLRNGMDNVWACAKFGGPVTGLALGWTVFFDNWRSTVFSGMNAVIAGLIIVLILILANRLVEVKARKAYGPYKDEEGGAEPA
ncbi:MAG: tetrahydromethanopterin S-methyltransferase subunit E [Candidatus Methanocomedens sp.]|jgi:tetrahydromethanopterin S-methyltransferase subunit E|nr:MAG: tetrahydromethanopterin S-methyltransferase subunit E [ANME-2 cluster archaeon]